MKKIKSLIFCIFTFFIITTPLCAAEWGHLAAIDNLNFYDRFFYLLRKIMNGETISYCIDGNTPAFGFERLNGAITESYYDPVPQDYENMSLENLQTKNVFEYWLSGTWKEIEKAGRQEEFSDLKQILNNPVKMNLQQCSNVPLAGLEEVLSNTSGKENYIFSDKKEDIRFIFYTGTENYKKTLGKKVRGLFRFGIEKNNPYASVFGDILYAQEDIPPFIIIKSEKIDGEFYKALIHETGHSFGMADTYRKSKNSSREYRTSRYPNALMNRGPQLTCDDADGLINLIDRLNNYKRGGKKGWRGLCKGYYRLYINSKPAIDLTEMKLSLELTKKAIRKNFENLRFDW